MKPVFKMLGTRFRDLVFGMVLLRTVVEQPHDSLRADEVFTHPYRGVTCIARKETIPRPLAMHVALVDLGVPGIRFKLSPPGGTRDTLRQSTLDFLKQEHAQLAINAHFYLPFATPDTNANVVGFAVSEGVVYSPFEPQPIGTNFAVQSYAILPYAPALNIDPLNNAGIVHHDPADPDHRKVVESVRLWTAVSGSAQIVSNGQKTIPSYSRGPGGLNSDFGYSNDYSWYDVLRARTAIGLTVDNRTLVLFTVDESGGSLGLSVGELADLLIRDYKVFSALNLDGDGSTSLAIEDPESHVGRLFNNSSGGVLGRPVGSSLAVFAPTVTQSEPELTITGTPTRSVTISWSAKIPKWELQRTSDLVHGNWLRIRAEPLQVGENFQIPLPITSEGGFYRLIH